MPINLVVLIICFYYMLSNYRSKTGERTPFLYHGEFGETCAGHVLDIPILQLGRPRLGVCRSRIRFLAETVAFPGQAGRLPQNAVGI